MLVQPEAASNMETMIVKTKHHLSMVGSTVVDIPSDLAFDVLADFGCHVQVFRTCKRMDLLSTPGMESALARPIRTNCRVGDAHRANHTATESSKDANTGTRADRSLVGSKYLSEYVAGGNRNYRAVCTITSVDADSDSNRYEISWAATMGSCTLTTTQMLHEVQPDQKQQQQQQQQGCDANEPSLCHLTFSFALIPNNWRGRLFLWFRGKQLQKEGAQIFKFDVEDLCAEVRRRMKATEECPLNPTIGKDSTASTQLTQVSRVAS